jgi:hypothetical protein
MNTEHKNGELKQEIKQLSRLRTYIPVLKLNVGLSDETINELLLKIEIRISQCKICIRENVPNRSSVTQY